MNSEHLRALGAEHDDLVCDALVSVSLGIWTIRKHSPRIAPRPSLASVAPVDAIVGEMVKVASAARSSGASKRAIDASSPGKGWLLKLKSKILKPPKGATLAETNLLANAASSLECILEECEKDPNLTIHLAQTAKQKSIMVSTPTETDRWPGYTRMRRIPKYWLANYLVSISNSKITAADLNRLEERDGKALNTIFYFCHQMSDTTEIPPQCLNKELMAMVLRRRHEALGSRFDRILSRNDVWDIAAGTFEESNLNSFDIIVQKSKAVVVVHCSGMRSSMPAGVSISKDFEIHDHLVDMRATLKMKGGITIPLHELFEPWDGPWQSDDGHPSYKLQFLANECEKDARPQQAQVYQAVLDAADTLQAAAQSRKDKVLAHARERLQDNREQEKKRRIIRVKMLEKDAAAR